ncbi:hypothetical protein ABT282_08400 [Streptomyces sp. NPDC000927]|uniref:hypothetical protein n=1 Tax=Streptomyces sp. NPDC000927 TaxID=3154371 RepID=UPI003324A278
MGYTFTKGNLNVHYLTAPYELLVAAFSDDGTTALRDTDKSTSQWDVSTPHGEVEVYDYMGGAGYGGPEPDRTEITDWHVQGDEEAIEYMLNMLGAASLSAKDTPGGSQGA